MIVKFPSSLKNLCITESFGVKSFSINSRKHIPDSFDDTRPDFRNIVVSGNCVSWIIVRYRENLHLSGNKNLLTYVIYVCHLRICSNKCILLLNTTTAQTETHQVVCVWGLSSKSCGICRYRSIPHDGAVAPYREASATSSLSAVASMSQTWAGHMVFVHLYHGCV